MTDMVKDIIRGKDLIKLCHKLKIFQGKKNKNFFMNLKCTLSSKQRLS